MNINFKVYNYVRQRRSGSGGGAEGRRDGGTEGRRGWGGKGSHKGSAVN
jgi:hypothetical protein